jgi:TIR domain-containing protein
MKSVADNSVDVAVRPLPFLSHSFADKPVAGELAQRLRNDGLNVWFDERIIKHGDRIDSAVDEGLARSRLFVLRMSLNASDSELRFDVTRGATDTAVVLNPPPI